MTDMDTAAGEGLRRRRTGGRGGPRAHAAAPAAAVAPAADAATARPRSSPRTSSSPSTSRRCGCSRRSAWTSWTRVRARSCGPPARDVEPGTQRVRFDPDMVTERHPDGAVDIHAARPEPGARPPHRRRLDGVRDGRQRRPTSSDLDRGRRVGNREDYQNLMRLGADAQHGPLPRPATRSSRSTSTPRVRHLHAIHDAADADGQGDPLLQPRPPAQHRRARDGAHRPRRRRGDARSRAVGLHGRQLELAAAARHADAPGDHRDSRGATRSCASRRSRWPGRWRR